MCEEPIKIVKVVVDKMPAQCSEYPFMANEFKGMYEGFDSECVALRNRDGVNVKLCDTVEFMPFRRHDCPLVVEEAQT